MEFALPNVSPVGTMAKAANAAFFKLASQDLPSAHVKHCCRPSLTSPPACDYFPQIFSPSCDRDKQETIFLGDVD